MEENEEFTLKDIDGIFRAHHKMLCKVAYAMLKDKNAAEDIVQDVFVNLWRRKDEVLITSNLKGYLYRSVSNSCLNYLQSYHQRNVRLLGELDDNVAGFYADEDKLDYVQLEKRVEQAIDSLPPRCRAIFILSRYEGLKYQQIAEHLQLSVKTVENQMGIALAKLREELKPYLKHMYLVLGALSFFFKGLWGMTYLCLSILI